MYDRHKVIISGKHNLILLPIKTDHIIIHDFKQMEKRHRLLILCLTSQLVLIERMKNAKNEAERKMKFQQGLDCPSSKP